MVSWPDLGTRVTVRYRRPAGSVPPLSDAVGHLLAVDPVVRVRTKTGAVVEFAPTDAVALRILTDAPVRTSDIRALEHAAAAAWPGEEAAWLDGWLLRAGPGAGLAANSAVPLDISAQVSAVPAIADWYHRRGLTPRLAIPDRLLRLPPGVAVEHTERVLVRDVSSGGEPEPAVALSTGPLSTVIDGGRAALTDAPDGTRWVGLSEIPGPDDQAAAALCEALLSWGAGLGATRGYLVADDTGTTGLADSLGFRLHHRRRYVAAMDTV
jgi:hypothetical protein